VVAHHLSFWPFIMDAMIGSGLPCSPLRNGRGNQTLQTPVAASARLIPNNNNISPQKKGRPLAGGLGTGRTLLLLVAHLGAGTFKVKGTDAFPE
jgi:hypothetical protein